MDFLAIVGDFGSSPASAAHEVYDLEFVSVFESGRFPAGARNDLQVQLHGNAVRLHPELGDEDRDGEPVGKVPFFAIELQGHMFQG